MRVFKNYWMRWFCASFVAGALFLPLVLVAFKLYQTASPYFPAGLPVIISDPYLEVTDFNTGKVRATGIAAWITACFAIGILNGILGLTVAAFRHFLHKT